MLAVRRRALAGCVAVVLASCAQVPPDRAPLPDVEQAVPEPLSCAFLVGDGRGVLVEGIVAGSPAEGVLAAGDVIVGIDGETLAARAELLEALAGRRPGEEVSLAIRRRGEDQSRGLVLGESPGDASRAFIGVNVLTDFERVPPEDLPDGRVPGPFSRLVDVGGELYEVDPETGLAARTGLAAPGGPWFPAGDQVYQAETADGESYLVDGDGGITPIGSPSQTGWVLIGSVGGDLLAVTLVDGEDGARARLLRLDPSTGSERWIADVPEELGFPIGAVASPDGSTLVTAVSTDQDRESIRFVPLDAGSGAVTGEILEALNGGATFGWFDSEQVLGQAPSSGEVILVDVATGESTPLDVGVELGVDNRVWGVGDGVGVLVGSPASLTVAYPDGGEPRVLVDRCPVGAVGPLTGR